jgi:hypothetical protein
MNCVKSIRLVAHSNHAPILTRTISTQVTAKKEGDISSVFASLSGSTVKPLPNRFAQLKQDLIRGKEHDITRSWNELLQRLKEENEIISKQGSSIIPQIEYKNIGNEDSEFLDAVRKRGVAVIRGVVPESEARGYKEDVERYVKANPTTKAFPQHDPQVFELYWSPAQVKARSHPNLLDTQKYLMGLWHSATGQADISTSVPLTYADRVRIRQPGDSGFALGPHQDGGGVERWEPEGYGRGKVYDKILQGDWGQYDPWEASGRILAVSDLYNGAGACSMFRMFQGWLGMSWTAPKEGTLLVNPLLQLSTAYILLRPFFAPKQEISEIGKEKYLDAKNWVLKEEQTSDFPGANSLGHSQELNESTHPHLNLAATMVHVPDIRPGDYVAWHCDTIHSVDKTHSGKSDSSVLYIPACPVTEKNAQYIAAQRESFMQGTPGPDFPGGEGESHHIGRATIESMQSEVRAARQAMGIERIVGDQSPVVDKANQILGF